MVQLEWHLWDMGKQDHDDMTLKALEAELCLEHGAHQGVFVFQDSWHAKQLWENQQSEILLWSHLCMCVKKEQSDFLPEPPERAKQLTSEH